MKPNCRRKYLIIIDETVLDRFHYCYTGPDADQQDEAQARIRRLLKLRVAQALAEDCPYYLGVD